MLHPPPKKKKNHKMIYTAQEVKFFIKYFFIICDHIRRKLLYHIVVSVARNNKKYLKIDIYFNHYVAISGQRVQYIETIPWICSANFLCTMITLIISYTTFPHIIFDFLEDILHPFL